jgi:crotonobetainyl-CoA:carnitine CoA-transferase CaiB-like acyl-CoA transferase
MQSLTGIRIVDLGGSVAGMAATMVLAEAGADVVLVEPPGGLDCRSAAGFRTWNRSKSSLELNVDDPGGLDQLHTLLADADVLVHSYGPTRAAVLGLDDESLAQRHSNLIVSSVLGWPVNHPRANEAVNDHLVLASLGICDEQMGQRDGPIFVRFPLGTWPAMWLATCGILARLISRDRTGVAGAAHTSLAQGALVPMMMHWSRAETPTEFLRIGMPKDNMQASLFECSDGRWIHTMPPAPDHTPLMQEVMAELGPDRVAAANDEFAHQAMRGFDNWGANILAYKQRTADQWLANHWDNDIPVQEAALFGQILGDEQARENRYVIDLDDPQEGHIAVAGLPLTLDPPAAVKTPAPALGNHQGWPTERSTPPDPTSPPTPAPLAGMKVLDFGNFLAGPLGPMLLADLGATVVKVEATTGDPMRYVDWPFAGCQRGKRAVALDIKNPASRPALDALLKWADVVHHNLRRPAAERLGLDAAAVRATNPDVIFCHVSSYGPLGPRSDWPGYDQLFQATCGWETIAAGAGNPPMWHRFGFMDHLCAMSSVAATLLAVFSNERGGPPTNVAASLLGAGVLTNSETFVRPDGSIVPVPTLDASQTTLSTGAQLLQTSDGWILLASATDSKTAALTEAAGSWTSADLLEKLARHDIEATAVRTNQREPFFDDPDNTAAGLVARYDHADWGQLEQPGAPWYLGDQRVTMTLAPPALGEHTIEVLREVGLEMSVIEQLLAAGAVFDRE